MILIRMCVKKHAFFLKDSPLYGPRPSPYGPICADMAPYGPEESKKICDKISFNRALYKAYHPAVSNRALTYQGPLWLFVEASYCPWPLALCEAPWLSTLCHQRSQVVGEWKFILGDHCI